MRSFTEISDIYFLFDYADLRAVIYFDVMTGVFGLKVVLGFEVSFLDSRVSFIESSAFVVPLHSAAGYNFLGYSVGNNSHKHYVTRT